MKYYITQSGALFLEAVSKKLIDGVWRTPEEQTVASRPFGHGVTRPRTDKPAPGPWVLRSPAPGKPKTWMDKPKQTRK